MEHTQTLAVVMSLLIPIVGGVALFTFLAVAHWAEERRREREAYYRSEVLKKLAESPGAAAQEVLGVLREEDRRAQRARREKLKVAGLVTSAVGAGVMGFLYAVEPQKVAWTAGLIPLLIGLALLAYVFLMAPSEP